MDTPLIGTISSGTLRPEDLLPALADALESVADSLDGDAFATIEDARRTSDRLDNEVAHDADAREAASYVLDDIYDRLLDYAPEYCYVGTLEGDGAEIGVWPDWDRIEMDEHDGELVRIDAGDEFPDPEPDGPGALLVVTDHGNATLYVRAPDTNSEPPADEWREAWAIV